MHTWRWQCLNDAARSPSMNNFNSIRRKKDHVSIRRLLAIVAYELCCIQKVSPDHSSKALLRCRVKLAKRRPGWHHNKRFRESVDTHGFHHDTAVINRAEKMWDSWLIWHRGQGWLFHARHRVLQYRMPLLESAAKLTDDFATQHVENAAGGPHYNLRECGLQLLYFSAHVGPANTHMTATL